MADAAMKLFFYGSLRYAPLLDVVLGRSAAGVSDSLADHAVMAVEDAPYPVIVPRAGAVAEGVLLEGVTSDDVALLDYYEGGFDYDLRAVTLASGTTAQVYFPRGDLPTDGLWDLEAWAAQWGSMSVAAAREVMGHFGTRSAAEIADMFEMIRARAAAQVRAGQSLHGAGTLNGAVEVQERHRAYTGYFAVDHVRLRHETFAGGMSPVLDRSAFVAADASIVLPYDPVTDVVLLVEQVRMGPLARGDRALWQLEPVAGRVDPGETPAEAAHREAQEEAGVTFTALLPLAETYASPGNSTEFHYIFVGLADLSGADQALGGLADEAEDIRTHVIPFAELMQMIAGMQVCNAPLLVAGLWLSQHRERLRASA